MLKYRNDIEYIIMAKRKMTLEEKRDLARNEIMQVSLELFLQKGYDKTTTRDIITQAGILNGSLYNRFKNKDEILISIVKNATEKVLAATMDILKKHNNFLEAAIFPGAIQLYVSTISPNVANLIYEVHCKRDAVKVFSAISKRWFEEFLTEYGYKLPKDYDLDMSLAALIGSVGTMVGCYVDGSTCPCREAIKIHALQVASVFNMPAINIDSIIDNITAVFDTEDLTFMGLSVSEHYKKTHEQTTL